ncbi:Tex-like N-terminal domain-containing protein [Shigella flexneri]
MVLTHYRKEITGGLDNTQLRNLETRLSYLRELEERRQAILKSISEQGKLTDDLAKAINTTLSKTELEDLSCPTNLNAAPAGESPLKQGLSRWLTCCGAIRHARQKSPLHNMLMPIKAWQIPKPRWMAHAIS